MNIHLLIPFSRHKHWTKLLNAYRPMGIILHPIIFNDEALPSPLENWIFPYRVPMNANGATGAGLICLLNHFLLNSPIIIDEDYYVISSDDDLFESSIFNNIRKCTAPVIFISMKRVILGDLIACPENVKPQSIGGEQIFMKDLLLGLSKSTIKRIVEMDF